MFFKNRTELVEKIKKLEESNEMLLKDNQSKAEEISAKKTEIGKLITENKNLISRYEQTGVECPHCYTILQHGFKYCPNCGNKIEKKAEQLQTTLKNKFQLERDGENYLIVGYNGFDDKYITIPSKIDGRTVHGIWNGVFDNCLSLEEVFFEEGCRYIGQKAFSKCKKLRKVHLPKSLLEIGANAFGACEMLEELIIPIAVRRIGANAFAGCSKLKKVILPEGLKLIEYGLLSNTAISEITIPESVIIIEGYAFGRTNIQEVTLPEQLRVLSSGVFSDCLRLKKITMHSNIEILEEGIFKGIAPIIQCAAGSKAQQYARKYNYIAEEIAPVQKIRIDSYGVQWIDVKKSKKYKVGDKWYNEPDYDVETWDSYTGECKAASYAYEISDIAVVYNELRISRYFTYDEAMQIKMKLEANKAKVSLFDYWGQSVV